MNLLRCYLKTLNFQYVSWAPKLIHPYSTDNPDEVGQVSKPLASQCLCLQLLQVKNLNFVFQQISWARESRIVRVIPPCFICLFQISPIWFMGQEKVIKNSWRTLAATVDQVSLLHLQLHCVCQDRDSNGRWTELCKCGQHCFNYFGNTFLYILHFVYERLPPVGLIYLSYNWVTLHNEIDQNE